MIICYTLSSGKPNVTAYGTECYTLNPQTKPFKPLSLRNVTLLSRYACLSRIWRNKNP